MFPGRALRELSECAIALGNPGGATSDDPDVSRGLLSVLLPLAGMATLAGPASALGPGSRAPRFPSASPDHWIGVPATWEALRGRVVLLDVWTFG